MSAPNYTLPPERRRGGRWCVVIPLLIGAGIAIGLTRSRERREAMVAATVWTPPQTPPAPIPPVPADPVIPPTPTPTTADPSETLLADTYPSREAAVRALAMRLPEMVRGVIDEPGDFRMTFEDLPASGAVAYDAIRMHFPRAHVTTTGTEGASAAKATPSGNDVVVSLTTDPAPSGGGSSVSSSRASKQQVAKRGTVTLGVVTAARRASLSTKFVSCDWADDIANYINGRPGRTWLIARSPLCNTAGDARRAAEENARWIVGAFVARTRGRTGVDARRGTESAYGDVSAIPLPLPLPIADRFVQRFKRPYGEVWSEAVLLDVSPQYLAGTARRYDQIVAIHAARTRTTIGSLLAVLVAILATYFVVNSMTRSYFSGRLRAMAIAGTLVVLAIAGTYFCRMGGLPG